jgi:hypothetical protein
MFDPPLLPQTVYTPFYCEENIYLLCEAFVSQREEVSAVFISNKLKTVVTFMIHYRSPLIQLVSGSFMEPEA